MSLPHPIQSQHTKKTGTHKAPFILGGLCALLCAQVLYGALVLSALHKQYAKPMQAVQALVCQELGNRLGRMTRLGKEPARIAQLDAVLTPYASGMMDSLMVLDGQRKVLAGWGQDLGTLFVLPEERHILHNNIETFSWSGHTWLSQPLKNQDENIVGHIVLGMDSAKQSARIWPILHNNIVILALTTCAAGLFLVLVVMRIPFSPGMQTSQVRPIFHANASMPAYSSPLWPVSLSLPWPCWNHSGKPVQHIWILWANNLADIFKGNWSMFCILDSR